MIFGFNSEVKHGDTVYHVQSEAQHGQRLLQTQVFVGGRCIGKCELLMSNVLVHPVQEDRDQQELLRLQHRQVLECIREGNIDDLFAQADLKLEWLNATANADEDGLKLIFRATSAERPVARVALFARIECQGCDPASAEGETLTDGTVSLQFSLRRELLAESTVFVEASHAGRIVSNKYRLHATRQATLSGVS